VNETIQYVTANGIRFAYLEEGSGPLVLLMHGFPDTAHTWDDIRPKIAAKGYRVVAPFLRGYAPSEIPEHDTDQETIARDVLELITALGEKQAILIGHDWGAVAAWWVATRYPEKLKKLAVLNCPHPKVWLEAQRSDPKQRRASWYVAAFQIPFLPEAMMRAGNFRALVTAIRQSTAPVSDEELTRYRACWSQPGELTATINWYRAAARHSFEPIAPASITPPIQIIWGQQDPYVLPSLAEASKALCRDARLTLLPEATHWVAHDAPDQVNAILHNFLT